MTSGTSDDKERPDRRSWYTRSTFVVPLLTAVVYFFSNPKPQSYYDYTFRVAGNMLGGSIGFADKPPSWLNEFVPFDGLYYSVFPLGAVISMVPAALLRSAGLITEMPGALISALLAAASVYLLLKIAEHYSLSERRRVLLTLAMIFGTFTWTDLTFAGAWQLALGFALVGELGAIYFSAFDRRPLVAGAFFALAFGNRTEILLTAPIFIYLLLRETKERKKEGDSLFSAMQLKQAAMFCIVPFVLGVATLFYNYVRFDSLTDFGYARIPGVLNEPWYDHGIFSTAYIPRQAWEMLLKPWSWRPSFPYLLPDPFSSSILLSSPFLLFALRVGAKEGALKLAAWAAVAVLTLVLWMHGNSGGWQFGYRYAMVLLPWLFVVLLEAAPKKLPRFETAAIVFSFAANLYATWLFHWTTYLTH